MAVLGENPMFDKKLREILEQLYYDKTDFKSNVTVMIYFDQIKSLLSKHLPKAMENDNENLANYPVIRGKILGFNQCNQQVRETFNLTNNKGGVK